MSQRREALPHKVPPHSEEAERAVLGGLLLDGNAFDQVIDIIDPEDFYLPKHQSLYRIMKQLIKQQMPVDVLTVSAQLKTDPNLEQVVGGELYLLELANQIYSAAHIASYAKIVQERALLRGLIHAGEHLIENAYAPSEDPINERLDAAEQLVFAIAEKRHRGTGPIALDKPLEQALQRIQRLAANPGAVTGVATGYVDFDRLVSGLQPADLIILAGRPSMGKTAFAVNIAEHALIAEKKPVLLFSMEMPADAIATRLLSSLGRIDQHHLRTGQLRDSDWPRITSAMHLLKEARLFIDDTPALNPHEVRARARRLKRQHGDLAMIVVDYLQLMQVPGHRENRVAEISEISRSLKALAKELSVPIVALSQLNRSLEQRTDKRPVMSDLRESGAIEQDADLIVFIYRDEVYHENSPDKGTAEVIVAKHRNGPIGKVRLSFLGQYTRFENFTRASVTEA